jgi:hypothetical protein
MSDEMNIEMWRSALAAAISESRDVYRRNILSLFPAEAGQILNSSMRARAFVSIDDMNDDPSAIATIFFHLGVMVKSKIDGSDSVERLFRE